MTARRNFGLVAGSVALAWIGLAAQQQQQQQQQGRGGTQTQGAQGGQGGRGANRDPTAQQPQPVGTGAISGGVILEGAGTPLRRARVVLAGTELRGQRTTTSDDQGRFSFTALPAGRFTLTASKTGYIDTAYGAKQAGRPGTPIQLADAQTIEKLTIRVPKGSVVTGAVVDEHGEPSPMTQVRVMKFVLRTGEKTLQQSGQGGITDDRGIYRIYGLQPGDYIVSATPRNANLGDLQQTILASIESLNAQAQAAGGGTTGGGGNGGGGRGGGGGAGGAGLGALLGGGGGRGGQQYLNQAAQLQQQLSQAQQEQAVGYAPVYYPGTPAPAGATTLTLGVGEERPGVDFQLQLVPTAKVGGTLTNPSGALPQGTQVVLAPVNQGMPSIPGVGTNQTRVQADGKFSFSNVTPGQYTISARAVRPAAVDPNQAQAAAQAAQRGGRGGPGGGFGGRSGPTVDVLWASADVTVSGQDIPDVALMLQEGMTITGRVEFRGQSQAPTDLTTVRVNVSPQGQQLLDIGPGIQPVQADANGTFTVKGVPPGKYVVRANISAAGGRGGFGGGVATGSTPATSTAASGRGGGAGTGGASAATPASTSASWTLNSSVANGRDTLDFPMDVRPNESPSGVLLTFTDKTQTLGGTLQDATGRPTSDYTIIVFAADKQYWTPQARRIASTRPGTDGKYSFRALPAGEYRITAVTDVEPGEWYDPAFLAQLATASIPVSLGEGQTKTQDLKLAGGH